MFNFLRNSRLIDKVGGKCFSAIFCWRLDKNENISWDSATFKTNKMCSTLISMRSAGRKAEKFYLSNWNWMTYLASPFLYIWPLMNWFCILIEKLGNPPTIYSVWNKDKSPVLRFVYLNFFQLIAVVIQSHSLAITWITYKSTKR